MTVAELIEKLKEMPQDRRVVTRGYEGGFDDVDDLTLMNIMLNFHKAWYYGPHEQSGRRSSGSPARVSTS